MFTLQHHFLGKDAGKTAVGALLMTMDAELHGNLRICVAHGDCIRCGYERTAAPTDKPATPTVIAMAKPTTQPTQQSPAPFLGIIAGLGAAAVLLRLRR